MGREWQIGDPVDGTTDGWMDAQNWGHGSDDDEEPNEHGRRNSGLSKRDRYSNMAWNYYMDFREEEALHYINLALDLDDGRALDWNRKGIILEALKRFKESEECYNKSLQLDYVYLVCDNKARMLHDWARQLIEESKELPNGLNMLNDAMQICIRAMKALPGENSEENIEKYLKLKDSIDFYLGYEQKFQRNLETLKSYPKEELFTITGTNFYKTGIQFTHDMPLKLVKDPYNEFDRDAIAVYAQDRKIGYVANSDYTKYGLTSSASELWDTFQSTAQASYLCYLDRYAPIQFHVARIQINR